MIAATALLTVIPFVPFALPKRIAPAVGPWIIAACSFSGLALISL
jgi:hypothetical protein